MSRVCRLGTVALILLATGSDPVRDVQHDEDEHVLRQAGWTTDGPGILRFLSSLTPSRKEQVHLALLVRQLGDADFRIREQAKAALLEAGPRALPALHQARTSTDLEIKRRAERCVLYLEPKLTDLVPAAVRLLCQRQPPGSTEILLALLPCTTDETVLDEIHTALVTLASTAAGDRKAFHEALQSGLPCQRGAAALVLACRGNGADRRRVRLLLSDPDASVRFHAAQGLIVAGDMAAMPVLIALLKVNGKLGHRAEDLLVQAAGQTAPLVLLGDSSAARHRCHAAWNVWWLEHQDGFALMPIDIAPCPNRRAREAASRFLEALGQGDLPRLQKISAVPFNLAGILILPTREEFEQVFREVMTGHKKNGQRFAFQVGRVSGGDEYLRTATAAERAFMSGLPKAEVRVVYMRGRFDEVLEEGALLVRVVGCRASVVGFGRAQTRVRFRK